MLQMRRKGHPAYHYTKKKNDKGNYDKSTKTTSSRAITKKLVKEVKKMSKAFTTVNTQLERLKETDSDMSDSDNEDKASHFQMADIDFGKSSFTFVQLDVELEPCITSIFNHTDGNNVGTKTNHDLREVIILDSKWTKDLFCN